MFCNKFEESIESEDIVIVPKNLSIYINHVLAKIDTKFVIKVLEQDYNLGKVATIYTRHKVSENDGHEYYSCSIQFKSWSNDLNVIEMVSLFEKKKIGHLKYCKNLYWNIKLFQNYYYHS
jgi:hypothetical protein